MRKNTKKLFNKNLNKTKPTRKQKKNREQYEDDSLLNIWRGHGFAMCGLGKKSHTLAKIKHFSRCIKWSKQRIFRGYADCDVWNMFSYVEELMPAMLQYLKDNRMGSPSYLAYADKEEDKPHLMGDQILMDKKLSDDDKDGFSKSHREWDKILDRMIFLWRELDEETCSKKNPYEEAHMNALMEFSDKYGFLGQKLETEEEKEKLKNSGGHYVHSMSELPEYAEIDRLYMEEEKRLTDYRVKCKDEVFDMMKKYFFDLWD